MTADADTNALQAPGRGHFLAVDQQCVEAAGLEFIPENGGGAGIRFREGKG